MFRAIYMLSCKTLFLTRFFFLWPVDGAFQKTGPFIPQSEYVTPAPPCGCGKGVVVVVCLYSMYVPLRNGDGFEDDVYGGAVP